jgi:hypothetical protein
MHRTLAVAILTGALAVPIAAQQARTTVTNADVLEMVRAGVSASIVVQSIRSASSVIFDTNPRALIDLKAAGVPDDVVSAMLARTGQAPATPVPSAPQRTTQTVTGRAGRSAAAAEANLPDSVTLQDGASVNVRLLRAVSSGTAQEGDLLRFGVLDDVRVDGQVVIAKGATAVGRVTQVKRAGAMGRSGALALTVTSVSAVDGVEVPVRLHRERDVTGAGRTGAAVSSIAIDAATSGKRAVKSAAGEVLQKGREATVAASSEYTVFVEGSRDIHVAAARKTRGGR